MWWTWDIIWEVIWTDFNFLRHIWQLGFQTTWNDHLCWDIPSVIKRGSRTFPQYRCFFWLTRPFAGDFPLQRLIPGDSRIKKSSITCNWWTISISIFFGRRLTIISHEQMLQGYLGFVWSNWYWFETKLRCNENIPHIIFNILLYYVLCYVKYWHISLRL